jgi:DNA polymerase III subunit beta
MAKPNKSQESKRLRILCHRHALLSACQLVSAAASRGDVKPALRCIKFVAEGERCMLMGTDLEIGIRLDVRGVKVDEAGAALLPCDRLLAILRETVDDEIVIDAGQDGVSVRGSSAAFDMPAEDVDGFPEVPAFTAEKYHEIAASALRDMIARTVFAVSAEGAVRFGATTGVLWELEGDKAALVATDGRRLALATGPAAAKSGHTTEGSMPVVPGKAMKLLARNLTEPDEVVRVAFGANDVVIQTGQTTICSRLVEGKFPAYHQVIPQKHLHAAKLVSAPLMASIRQAAIMADEGAGVNFKFAKRKLTLNAQGAESGKSMVELPVEFDGNKSAEIRFNSAYVTDMLRAVEPDTELTLELMAPDKPAVFRQEPNYLYVLVPLVSMAA